MDATLLAVVTAMIVFLGGPEAAEAQSVRAA